ncbi:hypothetical protein GCM10022245_08760 [Streptomyces mayteni]
MTSLSLTLAEPVAGDDTTPAGETAPSIAAEITPEVQWRMDQCRAGRILHAGGPYVKITAQGLMAGPEDQLREVLSYLSISGPLREAALNDFDYAQSIRSLVGDQVAELEGMAQRYYNGDDPLGYQPPDYSDEYQDFLFSLADGSGAVPGMSDQLSPRPSQEALARVAQVADENGDFASTWMAEQIRLSGSADDARMFLLYGGVPTTAPEPGTLEFELGVEELKARWASCDSGDPLIDAVGGVLTEQVSVAHDEWMTELASQAEQRDAIGATEVAAFVELIRAHEGMIVAVTQAWWADYLLRWQRYWSGRPTTDPRYPTQQEFARATSELSTARNTVSQVAAYSRTAANAAAQQVTSAQTAQQEAADIAAAAGYPEGRGLAHAQQAVQVVTASAAAADAAAYAAETARSAAQASVANSATLLSLAQTRAHAVQAEFRRAAAEEAAEQARSAAQAAAEHAERAEEAAVEAQTGEATAVAAEAEAREAANTARAEREAAEAARDEAASARVEAADRRTGAAEALGRAQDGHTVARTAAHEAAEAGLEAAGQRRSAEEAEDRARQARDDAVRAERDRDEAVARLAAMRAAVAATEGTENAAEARAAADEAQAEANTATAAATSARAAADQAGAEATAARAAATRATAAAERSRAHASTAWDSAHVSYAAADRATSAAANAIDASETAAQEADGAQAQADIAAQAASEARENAVAARDEANAAQEDSLATTNGAYATALAATAARDAATATINPANEAIALGTPYQESDPAAGLAVLTGQSAKSHAEQQAAAAEAKSRAAAAAAAEARRLAEQADADSRAAAEAAAEAAEDAAAALESVAAARSSAREAARAASAAQSAAEQARAHGSRAAEDAYMAGQAANQAESEAHHADNEATDAERDAERADQHADAAEADASEARGIAQQADTDANAAEAAATNADDLAQEADAAAQRAEEEARREWEAQRAALAETTPDPVTGGTGFGGPPLALDDEALLRAECGQTCVDEYRGAQSQADRDVIDWLIDNGGEILLEYFGINDLRRCLGQGNVESCLWSLVDIASLFLAAPVKGFEAVRTAIRTASRVADHWSAVQRARRALDRYDDMLVRLRAGLCPVFQAASFAATGPARVAITEPLLAAADCSPRTVAEQLRATGSVSRRNNIAAADVNIQGLDRQTLLSVSGAAERANTVPNVGAHGNPQRYVPQALSNQNPNNSRFFDTEFKLLNYIANQIGRSSSTVTGRIDLYSELEVCGSCSSVINQFRGDFPNVQINVSWG